MSSTSHGSQWMQRRERQSRCQSWWRSRSRGCIGDHRDVIVKGRRSPPANLQLSDSGFYCPHRITTFLAECVNLFVDTVLKFA